MTKVYSCSSACIKSGVCLQ